MRRHDIDLQTNHLDGRGRYSPFDPHLVAAKLHNGPLRHLSWLRPDCRYASGQLLM
jgi:hypothetical protein